MMAILNPWKLHRQGDPVSASFSITLWMLVILMFLILHAAVTGDRGGETTFFVIRSVGIASALVSFVIITRGKP